MRLFRLFVAALCLAALGFTAAPAHAAGTIKYSPIMWQNRPAGSLSNVLNRRDCLDDAVATTSVSILGVVGGQFELWSGAGCDQYANRSPTAVSRTCSKVTPNPLTPVNQELTIHFRDLIKAYTDDALATDAVCDLAQSPGLLTRTLYFVVEDPNTNMALATGATSWQFKYDIQAPPPPTNVSALSGDQSLVTSFTAVSGETNLLNYRFYCSPAGPAPGSASGGTAGTDTGGTTGTAGTAGTDTGGTAGTDTAAGGATDTSGTAGTAASTAGTAGTAPVTLDANCQSSILVPGQPAPADAIPCGSVKATGSSGGETSPVLENSGSYVVAVATEDNANNVGVLSGLACASPRDITGFYEAYRTAGGEAGGGYCSFAPATKGSVASMLGLLLGAAALLVRRRK